jgi:hypothetical protein
MAERQTTKIDVYGHPAVEAQKGEPMKRGTGWRLIKHWGRDNTSPSNPAVNFQATLLTEFDVAGKRLVVFGVRDWPSPQSK